MELKKSVSFVTLLLTMIAGYCDTITFVAADRIFSAHVTGNFIVFAYQMIKGAEADAWVKLLTFPVFVIAVMSGGWIANRFNNRHFLSCCQGLLLIVAGVFAYTFANLSGEQPIWLVYVVTMMIVFAMGFQNAFGKLFVKETHGPTTMMTGNVTQVSLDLWGLLSSNFSNADAWASLRKGLVTTGGFLVGCVLGAYAGKSWGLVGAIWAGVAMVVCYFSTKSNETSANA